MRGSFHKHKILMINDIVLFIALLFVAIGFSAVGHGGASGYTAVLLLFSYSPENIRPIVLSMNIIVTLWILFGIRKYASLDKRLFFTLIIASTPAAFIGGAMAINASIYRIIIGILLLISAARLLLTLPTNNTIKSAHIGLIILAGIILGWLSGLTGIGGGVLLSPLLLLLGWCSMRNSIPIVAGFILINSIAGLLGYYANHSLSVSLSSFPWWMLVSAFIGALSGSMWAQHAAKSLTLIRLLSAILLVAGGKMIYTAL